MIGYDLKTGAENWCVVGMPSCTCATPVVVDRTLFFAGWSPGDDVKPPTFDALLKDAEEEQQGYITREGLNRVFLKGMLDSDDFNHNVQGIDDLPGRLKGMFTSHDWDHDGKLTREEWDEAVKLLGTSKNSAFALKLGGSGDVTDSHVLWKQKSGLPYVPSGLVYRGQYVLVKDGGVVTIYDAESGKQTVSKAGRRQWPLLCLAGSGQRACLFHLPGRRRHHGDENGGGETGGDRKNPSLEERVAATPVIADDTLYVRTAGHLYAFCER